MTVSMKALIETMVQALVDQPESVVVRETSGTRVAMYEVAVAQGEVGKVIGKQGKIAMAIRMIASSAAMKEGKRIQIEILE